jgi:predicted Zn-dependent protease
MEQKLTGMNIIIQVIVAVLIFLLMSRPALAEFTIEDENKVGREFYEEMVKSHALVEDPRIVNYVRAVGQRITSQLPITLFDFHFSVIRSSAVNAFATPGGYIYVNSGLISLVEKESQLAGVMSHETGHIQSRHIAQMISKSQKVSIGSLAAILAGAFLGGGSNLTAGIAGFSMATATSLSLKYSRENEEEADRKGMGFLVKAGYDPQAMVDFMKIMKRYEYFSNTIPSYFLTHPGTEDRIAYLDSLRITTYPSPGKDSIVGHLKRIQTLIQLDDKDQERALKHFQNDLRKNPSDVDDLYGLAVTLNRLGRNTEAMETFQKVLSIAPDDMDVIRDLGICYYQLGQADKAIIPLKEVVAAYPNDVEAALYLGKVYNATGNYSDAIKLFNTLKPPISDDADVHYNLAVAYGKTDQAGWSHYHFAMYFKKKRRFDAALFHLKAAQLSFSEYSPMAEKIETEIQSMGAKDKSLQRKPRDSVLHMKSSE